MQNVIKWILLLILFFPAVYFAFKQKKWYLYLVCTFVGILPDQFAFELSSSLPLLTVERILILVLLGFWCWKKWKEKKFSFPLSLLIYFGINVLISLVNIRFGAGNELKRIAILLLERVLLILMLADLIEDRKEFDNCIDCVILSCVAMSAAGIIQTIFEFDITSVLALTEGRYTNELTPRMGIIRAFGTSNAISFGCYCAFMALVIFYRLERTGKQRYSLALALDIVALICTLTRSAWLCLGGMAFLLLLFRPRKFIARIWPAMLFTVLLVFSLFFVNSSFKAAIVETGKSSINTVLSAIIPSSSSTPSATDPDTTEPTEKDDLQFELSEDFGSNANPTRSRLVEWTAVTYMLEEGHGLFGYGYNAFINGKLHYFYPQFGHWTVAKVLDVGLLAIITESGIIGLLTHIAFLGYLFVVALRKRGPNGTFRYNKLILYLIVQYFLLNFMAAFTGSFWLMIGLFYASMQLDEKGLLEETQSANHKKWMF